MQRDQLRLVVGLLRDDLFDVGSQREIDWPSLCVVYDIAVTTERIWRTTHGTAGHPWVMAHLQTVMCHRAINHGRRRDIAKERTGQRIETLQENGVPRAHVYRAMDTFCRVLSPWIHPLPLNVVVSVGDLSWSFFRN